MRLLFLSSREEFLPLVEFVWIFEKNCFAEGIGCGLYSYQARPQGPITYAPYISNITFPLRRFV